MRLRAWILVVGLLVLPTAAASAAPVVGIADQSGAMFSSPLFRRLDVPISRLVVSYDAVLSGTSEVNAIDRWLAQAASAGVTPLVAFNASRGCYDGVGVVHRLKCRLPTVARYRRAFRVFRQRYPAVSDFSPWNEANHRSQPTQSRADRAAAYYAVVRADCRGCNIVAADVLDQRGMQRWLRGFLRALARVRIPAPRIWGLHNYQDVNNGTSRGTRAMLRTVPGEVWLTETGGIVKLGRHRPFDPARAGRATDFMFKLADLSLRITRLYIYEWSGSLRSARFDAGLISPGGASRPAYYVVANHLAQRNPRPIPVPPAPVPPAEPPLRPPPPPTPTDPPAQPPTPTVAPPPRQCLLGVASPCL